jgi:hypothetical protein
MLVLSDPNSTDGNCTVLLDPRKFTRYLPESSLHSGSKPCPRASVEFHGPADFREISEPHDSIPAISHEKMIPAKNIANPRFLQTRPTTPSLSRPRLFHFTTKAIAVSACSSSLHQASAYPYVGEASSLEANLTFGTGTTKGFYISFYFHVCVLHLHNHLFEMQE